MHSHARLIVYIKELVNNKVVNPPQDLQNLPLLTLDFNMDFYNWTCPGFSLKELVDMMNFFMTDVTMSQVVDMPTRVVMSGGEVVRTLVDHCYVTAPQSYSTPKVVTVGDSDHLGQVVSLLSNQVPPRPATIKARVYKRFILAAFLLDLADSEVSQEDNFEGADEVFHRELLYASNEWVPLKTIQLRKSHGPPCPQQPGALWLRGTI